MSSQPGPKPNLVPIDQLFSDLRAEAAVPASAPEAAPIPQSTVPENIVPAPVGGVGSSDYGGRLKDIITHDVNNRPPSARPQSAPAAKESAVPKGETTSATPKGKKVKKQGKITNKTIVNPPPEKPDSAPKPKHYGRKVVAGTLAFMAVTAVTGAVWHYRSDIGSLFDRKASAAAADTHGSTSPEPSPSTSPSPSAISTAGSSTPSASSSPSPSASYYNTYRSFTPQRLQTCQDIGTITVNLVTPTRRSVLYDATHQYNLTGPFPASLKGNATLQVCETGPSGVTVESNSKDVSSNLLDLNLSAFSFKIKEVDSTKIDPATNLPEDTLVDGVYGVYGATGDANIKRTLEGSASSVQYKKQWSELTPAQQAKIDSHFASFKKNVLSTVQNPGNIAAIRKANRHLLANLIMSDPQLTAGAISAIHALYNDELATAHIDIHSRFAKWMKDTGKLGNLAQLYPDPPVVKIRTPQNVDVDEAHTQNPSVDIKFTKKES